LQRLFTFTSVFIKHKNILNISMASFKEKSQIFIIGLLIGLLVAGSFFLLKLDTYFKELNVYKRISNTFTPAPSNTNKEVEKENAEVKNKTTTTSKENNKQNTILETTSTTNEKTERDTSSTFVKDSAVSTMNASDEIVVRKDELLSTKTLEVINLDPVATKATAKDSLLQKVSGIKEDKSNFKQFLNIEFWSSPLNYKGYKMSKYKLIVYGIASADGLKLVQWDDVIYLKSAGMVYRLDAGGDFKPYERITDESIITKLK
jgi:hypothetical protein